MNQVDKEFITRLKGKFTEKYAIQMDDWTAVILNELSEGVSKLKTENNQSLTNSIRHIDAAAGQIKGQFRQVRFDSPRQALFYGFGNHLLYGLTCLIGICSVIWFYSIQNEFAKKRHLSTSMLPSKNSRVFTRTAKRSCRTATNFLSWSQ